MNAKAEVTVTARSRRLYVKVDGKELITTAHDSEYDILRCREELRRIGITRSPELAAAVAKVRKARRQA